MNSFLAKFGVGSQGDADPAESQSLLSEWRVYNQTAIRDVETPSGTVPVASTSVLVQTVDRAKSRFSQFFSSSYTVVSQGVASGVAALPTAESLSIPSAQQITFFFCFIGAATIFLLLSFMLFLPIIVVVPAKFALSFTLGCLCVMLAFGALRGWKAQLTHMTSMERLPFTAVYLASIIATLFAAIVLHSYILSLVCSGAQMVALLYYTMSYFPGGTQGARFMVSAIGSTVAGCFGRLFK